MCLWQSIRFLLVPTLQLLPRLTKTTAATTITAAAIMINVSTELKLGALALDEELVMVELELVLVVKLVVDEVEGGIGTGLNFAMMEPGPEIIAFVVRLVEFWKKMLEEFVPQDTNDTPENGVAEI